jgi:hypothetical protein
MPSAESDSRLPPGELREGARKPSAEIPSGQNSDADKITIEKFANYYRPVAKTFGCKEFAWGSFVKNHQLILLEYVPEGDDVKSWTRLMSINLYPLPKEKASQVESMNRIGGWSSWKL